jgi:ribosome-binding factor A
VNRTIRLAEQIRIEVGEILAREVRDPGVGFLTLTRVKVTDDLQQVRIFYTAMGDAAERKKTTRALERALPFIRRALGQRLQLRRVPEIAFRYDEGVATQARVEELLEQIKRADESGNSQSAIRPSTSSARPEPDEGRDPQSDDSDHE